MLQDNGIHNLHQEKKEVEQQQKNKHKHMNLVIRLQFKQL